MRDNSVTTAANAGRLPGGVMNHLAGKEVSRLMEPDGSVHKLTEIVPIVLVFYDAGGLRWQD